MGYRDRSKRVFVLFFEGIWVNREDIYIEIYIFRFLIE